jgi:hypothetical protein
MLSQQTAVCLPRERMSLQLAWSALRIHSVRRIPTQRAGSSSKVNSALLALVSIYFVQSGSSIEHPPGRISGRWQRCLCVAGRTTGCGGGLNC